MIFTIFLEMLLIVQLESKVEDLMKNKELIIINLAVEWKLTGKIIVEFFSAEI
jgi:hypothetical protein